MSFKNDSDLQQTELTLDSDITISPFSHFYVKLCIDHLDIKPGLYVCEVQKNKLKYNIIPNLVEINEDLSPIFIRIFNNKKKYVLFQEDLSFNLKMIEDSTLFHPDENNIQ